jgi:hypothetical protein
MQDVAVIHRYISRRMLRAVSGVLLALAALTLAGCATHAPAGQPPLAQFVALWAGDYDNFEQVQEQARRGVPAAERNTATQLHIRRVELPAFGQHVFYAEWRDRDDAAILRQRIYAFELDAPRRALRLNLHIWPNDRPAFVAQTAGAYLDPARLAGVTPAAMAPLTGCDVYFARAARAERPDRREFAGAMDPSRCWIPLPEGDRRVYSWSQMRRDKQTFRYLDGWFNADGSVYRKLSGDWYVFVRR